MTPCLEPSVCGEATPEWQRSAAGEGAESPRNSPAGTEAVPESASDLAPKKGAVLVLEDDSCLRESIIEALAESGYETVAVEHGGEGIREVLARDFTVVLCDIMMPALRGDVFYRAVERIRPELCRRFVFLTGNQQEAVKSEFLANADVLVLGKPFSLKTLMEMVSIAELRGSCRSLFEDCPDEIESEVAEGDCVPAKRELSEKLARILTRAEVAAAPTMAAIEAEAMDEEHRAKHENRALAFSVLGLLMLVVAIFLNRYWVAREGVEKATAEHFAAETKLNMVSSQLQESLALGAELDASQKAAAALAAERSKSHWTPGLKSLVPPGDALIDILEVRGNGDIKGSAACEIRVRGLVTGAHPLEVADRFRMAMEGKLKSTAPDYSVNTRFEDLAETSGEHPVKGNGEFVIIATVSASGAGRGTNSQEIRP